MEPSMKHLTFTACVIGVALAMLAEARRRSSSRPSLPLPKFPVPPRATR